MTSQSLASQLVERCNRPMDAALLKRARLHVLDWMGCVYGATLEEPAQLIRATLTPAPSAKQNNTPGFGIGRLPFEAAFAYSTALGNVLEMDDLARTAIVHPGPVVVPAALYTAIQHDSSYSELLQALVRGYEAAIRLGNSLDGFHYQRWHPTSTAGVAGATMACASIHKLDTTQQLTALCNALSVSGGLWHTRHGNSTTKQWHSVHTVQTGMNAVQSALLGFSAAASIIEGKQGWHEVMAEKPSVEEIVKEADWAILQTSFKPWPACRHCHAAIDAALKLREQLTGKTGSTIEFSLQNITGITIDTYNDAKVFCDNSGPVTVAEARFSLQHSVAVTICNGNVLPDDFAIDALAKTNIATLRELTTVHSCTQLTTNYPAHFGTTVTLQFNDGDTIRQDIVDAMGDPEWPLSAEQIRAKFDMLCDWGIGDCNKTNELAEAVLHAPGNTKVSTLLKTAP